MADAVVQITAGSGTKIDTSELTVGANTVERQRLVVADDATAAALAKVQNAAPGASDYGLTVRPANGLADLAASGTLNALNANVQVAMAGYAGAGFVITAITGTPVLTFDAEASKNGGTTWETCLMLKVSGGRKLAFQSQTSSLAGEGYEIDVPSGASHVRVTCTGYTSGSTTLTLRATTVAGVSRGFAWNLLASTSDMPATPIGGSDASANLQMVAIRSAPLSGTGANALVVRPYSLSNGTDQVAIKAASTAALATDPSFVVALHPTSPVPAGTNLIGSIKVTDGTNLQPTGDAAARAVISREAGITVANKVMIVAIRAAGVTSEGMLTLVKVVDTTAAGGVSTGIAATNAKTLRILSAHLTCRAGAAAAAWSEVALRLSASANVTTSTQAIAILGTPATAAVSGATASDSMTFGEAGLEISGTELLGASQLSQATTNLISLTLTGYEY